MGEVLAEQSVSVVIAGSDAEGPQESLHAPAGLLLEADGAIGELTEVDVLELKPGRPGASWVSRAALVEEPLDGGPRRRLAVEEGPVEVEAHRRHHRAGAWRGRDVKCATALAGRGGGTDPAAVRACLR
ncbi:MAG: hypothetical protein ACYC2Z_11605 [Candidatus Nanopelagicales bacterium]